jgi:tetratricopeptide (TPR) repeat protein
MRCVNFNFKIINMKRIFTLTLAMMALNTVFSQLTLTRLPSGNNKKAMVGERVGLTDILIEYSRPGVNGREGKIWGQLVYKGFENQGFGNSKASPWRAGANENTTIEFSNDVMIEGQPLKKGKYGFFIAYDSLESTAIFSSNYSSWGNYYYDDREDVLRVKIKPVTIPNSVERLKYEFMDQTDTSATIALAWEKLMIPVKVNTNYTNDQLASFRDELRSQKGFYWQTWQEAAQWSLQHNVNLEQALLWADTASGPVFGGNNVFGPQATKAQILRKFGRDAEAEAIMKTALPLANMQELHVYGRELIRQKKAKEALEVFQLNYKKNPDQFTSKVGMARGYSANGDYKNALKFAQLALPQAPDALNKTGIENMIEKLKKSQDAN